MLRCRRGAEWVVNRSTGLLILKRLLRLLAVALLLVTLTVVLLRRWLEDRILYMPSRDLWTTPAAAGLPFAEVALRADDGVRLHAWHVRATAPRGLVVFLHGNAGNIADRVPWAEVFAREGLETLLLDYRGYGRSEGRPSEDGLYRDAAAARDWAKTRNLPVAIYGESLGGAVAIELAARRAPDALIAQSTFTTLREIAARVFPFGGALVRQHFASVEKIGRVSAPVLIIHGDRDQLIPHAMGLRLFQAAGASKELLTIPGADHNDLFDRAGIEIAAKIRALLIRSAPTK